MQLNRLIANEQRPASMKFLLAKIQNDIVNAQLIRPFTDDF